MSLDLQIPSPSYSSPASAHGDPTPPPPSGYGPSSRPTGRPRVHMPRIPHIPRPRELRDLARDKFQPEGTSGALLLGWVASAVVAVLVPLSQWVSERNRYRRYYGQYNAYNNYNGNNGNGNYNNYNNGNNGNNGGNGYYSLCSWYDLACKYKMRRYQQMYGNGNNGGGGGGEGGNMAAALPGWYYFFGGTVQGDEREREENGTTESQGAMMFVYACTLCLFLGLAALGFRSMYAGKDRAGVILALLTFGLFSFLNLLTAVRGTIQTDDRAFENSVYGWSGQWSVLVASTDAWLALHCLGFAGLLGLLRCRDGRRAAAAAAAPDEAAALEMGYRAELPEDPSIRTERIQ